MRLTARTGNASTRRAALLATLGAAWLGVDSRLRAQPKTRSSDDVSVQYLGWAGIKLEFGDNALFIDPQLVFQSRPASGVKTAPIESRASSRYAAITHLHRDHFDPAALKRALSEDGTVFAAGAMAASVAAAGLPVTTAALWEPLSAGGFDGHDFMIVAVPAMDGFGEPQVSWVVRVGGRRFIHCGDTIWHGHWRQIGGAFGPFDLAFLPINAFNQTDLVPPSDVPYSMSPEMAVQAARLLRAKLLVPIHFGREPSPVYVETGSPEPRLLDAAAHGAQAVRVMQAGDELRLASTFG